MKGKKHTPSPEEAALDHLQSLARESTVAESLAATSDPLIILSTSQKVLEAFRAKGGKALFQSEAEMGRFCRSTMEEILVAMLSALRSAVEQLAERLGSPLPDGKEWEPKTLLNIAESLSSQVRALQGIQQASPPRPVDSLDDLEARIAELEARRATRALPVGNGSGTS